MVLREAEQHRARKRRKQKRKTKVRARPTGIGHNLGPPLAPPLAPPLDDQVLTFRQWAALNSLGERTARRLIKLGGGPAVVQLSERRIGITIKANREWQAAQERA